MVYPVTPQATVAEVEAAIGRNSAEWSAVPPEELIAAIVKVTDDKRDAEMQRRARESLTAVNGNPRFNG